MIDLSIVCTHFRDDLDTWVLSVPDTVKINVYDCRVQPIAQSVRSRLDNILPKEPDADQHYSCFDFICQNYTDLPEYLMILHGHNTSWHQNLTVAEIINICQQLSVKNALPQYMNLNENVYPDWFIPVPPGRNMCELIQSEWSVFNQYLPDITYPVNGALDINAAQCIVHKSRLLARPLSQWQTLREMAEQTASHKRFSYVIEGYIHVIFGEPWHRPYIKERLEKLRDPNTNELLLRMAEV